MSQVDDTCARKQATEYLVQGVRDLQAQGMKSVPGFVRGRLLREGWRKAKADPSCTLSDADVTALMTTVEEYISAKK